MTAQPWYANAPLSMAHLCELDTPPAELITLAAEAGIASVGFRVSPAAPGGPKYPLATAAEQAEVRRRAKDTGVEILYVELISITEETRPEDFRAFFETGAAIGASRCVVAGDSPNIAVVAEKMARLCDIAKPLGIAVDIEFMPFRGIKSLADAVAVVASCQRSSAHILIDSLHITRSGTTIESLRALDPRLVGTFQICDGPLAPPADLVTEARMRRQTPGAGEMALFDMLDALPAGTIIGVEVPLPPQYPNVSPRVRLAKLAAETKAFLSKGPRS